MATHKAKNLAPPATNANRRTSGSSRRRPLRGSKKTLPPANPSAGHISHPADGGILQKQNPRRSSSERREVGGSKGESLGSFSFALSLWNDKERASKQSALACRRHSASVRLRRYQKPLLPRVRLRTKQKNQANSFAHLTAKSNHPLATPLSIAGLPAHVRSSHNDSPCAPCG